MAIIKINEFIRGVKHMKRVIKRVTKVFTVSFLLINTFILPVNSENVDLFKVKLEEIGIPEEYSKNISDHIENLDISAEEFQAIMNNSSEVFSRIEEGQEINDFSLSDLVGIYSEALRVANDLDIEVKIDSNNKEVEIKDKENDEILLKCHIEDVKKYYENYKKSPLTDEEYDDLLKYIDSSDDSISNNNEDSSVSEKKDTNENSINNDMNEDDTNIDKVEVSDASNTIVNDSESNSSINKADTISQKNRYRVLSIIYLVLLLCVLLSIVSSKLFKEKDEKWQ